MKAETTRTAVCPICGRTYHGHPAISREDSETPICPDCGTRQAMAAMGVSPQEQDEIVRIIHEHMRTERAQ